MSRHHNRHGHTGHEVEELLSTRVVVAATAGVALAVVVLGLFAAHIGFWH